MSTKIKNIHYLIIVFLLTVSSPVLGQEETDTNPMVTDRPDATEAPTTVKPGFIQVETGAFYESYEENSVKLENFVYNTTLVRIGLLESLEARIGWNYEELRISDNTSDSHVLANGLSPLLFGAKVAITEEKGWLPEIGLIGHIFLPFTASKDFKPEYTGMDFRFSFAHTLSEKSSIAYNIGAQWGDDSPEAAYIYTLAYGYGFTDTFGAYIEIYGDFPEDSRANHLWDAGVTYLINPNVQLDATVGTSITEGQDLLLSAGVSFRLPK